MLKTNRTNGRKVELGNVYMTRGVASLIQENGSTIEIAAALVAHSRGDWGDVCREDRKANDDALLYGGRLLSVYHIPMKDGSQVKVWVITEADRSSTTVLLPDEY